MLYRNEIYLLSTVSTLSLSLQPRPYTVGLLVETGYATVTYTLKTFNIPSASWGEGGGPSLKP